MTFAQGVLRLVRSGSHSDTEGERPSSSREADAVAEHAPLASESAAVEAAGETEAAAAAYAVELFADDGLATDQLAADSMAAMSRMEPGFSDIEAAVALVECGLATRVVLTGFPSWPGLLWQAYQLAEAANVLILPTVTRPGGRVDIVIARDAAQNV